MYRHRLKPLIDRLTAVTLLLILSPVLLLVALATRMFIGSPILFRQPRLGIGGKSFTLMKFRTMTESRDAQGRLASDDVRLTRFGRMLRSTSLDELPELVNVLNGDMSLVGPRPLLCQYLERYSVDQSRRHEVKPGITGWAQVNGRNALQWEEKFRLDVWYVDHCSFLLDIRILLVTVWKTLLQQGISEAEHGTAREFMGSPPE